MAIGDSNLKIFAKFDLIVKQQKKAGLRADLFPVFDERLF